MAEEVTSPKSPTPAPAALRRSLTGDDSTQYRHRSTPNRFSNAFVDPPSPGIRRRSSNFSDYSLNEARKQFQSSTDDILLPKPSAIETEPSHWHSAPLAFALLPAVGGMLFQNGSSVVTDIMLLGLAAIFLNWSVRLPWDWYHSAQEVRNKEEYDGDTVIEEESGDENGLDVSQASLDDVPEDGPAPKAEKKTFRRLPAHEKASNELYIHELLALLSCFLFPLLGAYLLHTIRGSLSRPSEGLVSNYNLTIFLLASELRPMSHLVKLIQARTLHLQRIVSANPYDSVSGKPAGDMLALLRRIDDLENRPTTTEPAPGTSSSDPIANGKQTAIVMAEVRRTLQPELDALNRAVRRYEKRAAIQTMQTESRLMDIDARLADAITLAAAAAQNGQRGLGSILVEWTTAGLVLPLQAFGSLASLPFKTILALVEFGKVAFVGRPREEYGRKPASGRYSSHSRMNGDRLQAKGLKR